MFLKREQLFHVLYSAPDCGILLYQKLTPDMQLHNRPPLFLLLALSLPANFFFKERSFWVNEHWKNIFFISGPPHNCVRASKPNTFYFISFEKGGGSVKVCVLALSSSTSRPLHTGLWDNSKKKQEIHVFPFHTSVFL